MTKPVGSIVAITYDAASDTIAVGDWLRTGTGRAYQVLEVKTVRRGPNAGTRHKLSVLVADEVPHGAPPNARVHALYWYKREKRSRPR